ncbi:crotonase/enoyl-CoA hydratase family protein [Nocardia sp. SC052]|uniref:crotonase/enoyl-CoA hydratase family protein n=1 Tax=Nocardia sichangensis TaxID=3385975 RepID=UPI0039A0AA51
MTESPILTERDGACLIITMNRPHVRNAFDDAMSEAMATAHDMLDDDDGLWLAIIHGAGGNFSAGADLKALARGEQATTARRGNFGMLARPSRKPVIAAIEGSALGGGFEVALACDLIVASYEAQFGLPEVKYNLVAVGGGLFRLPRRMPYHAALEIALSGDPVDAEIMYQWGVVNRVTAVGNALPRARRLADMLLRNGPTALAATKQIVAGSADWTSNQAWDKQMAIARTALEAEDATEGILAFAEKRAPHWKGR